MEQAGEDVVRLQVRWHGRVVVVEARPSDTVGHAKRQLTGVAPRAQKLLGLLPRGGVPPDHASLAELGIHGGQRRCMLVGIDATSATQLAADEEEHQRALSLQRTEPPPSGSAEAVAVPDMERDQQQEQEEVQEHQLEHPPAGAYLPEEGVRLHQEPRPSFTREGAASTAVLDVTGLCAYSSTVAGNARLDRGNKIVLPVTVLEEAVSKGVSFPLIFRVARRETGDRSSVSVAHCGVLNFDAPAGMCYLPRHIMNKLNLREGDPVTFTSVHLPKGEYAQLQPESSLWTDIPASVREALLSDQLRNYQTLSIGDEVVLFYDGNDYLLHVMQVKPHAPEQEQHTETNQTVSIIDADIAVDIMEPREPSAPITTIELNSQHPTMGELSQNSSALFALRIDLPASYIRIEVNTIGDGDVDLYVSHTPDNKRPTPLVHTWKVQNYGAKRLQIETTDPRMARAVQEGWLYINVHAYQTPPGGTVRFSLECRQGLGDGSDQGQQVGHAGLTEQTEVTRCPSCRREVPTASYALHEMACMRHNWRCSECGEVIPIAEKDKHRAVAHVVAECGCGARLPPSEMQVHKEFECPYRPVPCLYCDLLVPLEERGSHQGICGNRTVTCTLCHSVHKRNAIKKHVVEEHGIYPHHVTTEHYIP